MVEGILILGVAGGRAALAGLDLPDVLSATCFGAAGVILAEGGVNREVLERSDDEPLGPSDILFAGLLMLLFFSSLEEIVLSLSLSSIELVDVFET